MDWLSQRSDHGGIVTTKQRGGARKGAGRKPAPLDKRTPQRGKVWIGISPAAAAQLQQFMMRSYPGVETPEQMVEYLIRKELTMQTIIQTAKYSFTKKIGDLDHGAAYLDCHPGTGAEFVGHNDDGTETWELDGVTMPDALERLFDTDSQVVSYYQIAPLLQEDAE